MRILIVTDAWSPQINGVVTTIGTVVGELRSLGHTVESLTPDRFRTIPCPSYPEIRLALDSPFRLPGMIEAFAPEAIHIATEGPLGFAARSWCLRRGRPFTTAYHTRFPEYIHARYRVPPDWTYALLRRFHRPSRGVMVATRTIRADLEARGFANVVDWSRGVDTDLFRPRDKAFLPDLRPIWLYVGRVAVEKNIEAFLRLDLPGTKYVVGDGPMLRELRRRHPAARFPGTKRGEELARHFAAADVFVFPSRTDTFGLVLLEALASGIPVAAYPVPGPLDVIGGSGVGVLDDDLGRAARAALSISGSRCRDYALGFSWTNCARQFLGNLCPFTRAAVIPANAGIRQAGDTAPDSRVRGNDDIREPG